MTTPHLTADILPPTATAPGYVRKTSWRVIAYLTLILFGGRLTRTVFSPLQEAAKLDLRLSDFDISLVRGLAAGVPVAAIGLPLAWVIDHGHRAQHLGTALAATGVLTGLVSFGGYLFAARNAPLSATEKR
jgi:hypothetical protein